ncbi:MAG: class II aldolase/adducin family protein [Chloroflexota bacterium]
MVAIGRKLADRGLVSGTDGNLSLRLPDGLILTTPTGRRKGELRPDELVVVAADGRVVSPGKPSSELPLHLRVYAERPDVGAVVHAHPPYTTAFAVARRTVPSGFLPEVLLTIGEVALAPYGTPSTDEVPDRLAPLLADHECFVMMNHGALCLGPDLLTALNRLETLELAARVFILARELGGAKYLSSSDAEKLRQIRDRGRK